MLISDLIEQLEGIMETYGDISVFKDDGWASEEDEKELEAEDIAADSGLGNGGARVVISAG